MKMLQESYPPGKMIPRGHIPLSTLSVQNSIFLYDSIVHPYHKGCSDKYGVVCLKDASRQMLFRVYACSDHVYTQYIHGMYNFTFLWTCISRNKKMVGLWFWSHDLVHTSQQSWLLRHQRDCTCLESRCYYKMIYLGVGDTRKQSTGPAAPPAPSMTSPAGASTRISLKQQSAAKQALVARMWRHTAALLRNSLLLERWLVAVQLTQMKRLNHTGPQWILGGPASGPAMDAITTTNNRVTVLTS